jgi:hypothetical protein
LSENQGWLPPNDWASCVLVQRHNIWEDWPNNRFETGRLLRRFVAGKLNQSVRPPGQHGLNECCASWMLLGQWAGCDALGRTKQGGEYGG